MAIKKDNSGAGVHTIIFALKVILGDTDEEQKQRIITPNVFGKIVKEWNIYDHRRTLTQLELKRYRNQLMNAYDFWEDDEWNCKMRKASTVKLIFIRNGGDDG